MDSRKLHLPIHWVGTIALTLASGVGAYYKALADIRDELASQRLDNERSFVRKDDFSLIREKLTTIAVDVAEIKGRLKSGR